MSSGCPNALVLWNSPTRQFYLYYHGENTTTRMAVSTDGIHFTYFGVVLTTGAVPGSTEASYARVFEHTVTGLGNRYVTLYMGVTSGSRKIFWGWSADGRSWALRSHPSWSAPSQMGRPISPARSC